MLHQLALNSRKTEQPLARAPSTAAAEYGIFAAAAWTATGIVTGTKNDNAISADNNNFLKAHFLLQVKVTLKNPVTITAEYPVIDLPASGPDLTI